MFNIVFMKIVLLVRSYEKYGRDRQATEKQYYMENGRYILENKGYKYTEYVIFYSFLRQP
jgi:hypothetical protein